MNKNAYLVLLIGFTFLLVGCDQNKLPYIEKSSPIENNIIKPEETFNLKLFVENPTVNTFVGSLNYTFDEKCLNIVGGKSDEVEVPPKSNKAIVKDFSYQGRKRRWNSDQYDITDIPECYQRNLQISVALYDKSGLLRDTENFFLTISK